MLASARRVGPSGTPYGLDMTEEMLALARAGCIAGALSRTEYQVQLAAAGFTDISVRFTHPVGDGLHSAIIKATRPTEATSAARPVGARRELPVVQQSGCC